jgi:hypothetical protein
VEKNVTMLYLWGNKVAGGGKREEEKGRRKKGGGKREEEKGRRKKGGGKREETHAPTAARAAGT